ncbi:MAG: magnesium chelatase subunit D [Gemmobacter sp.]
MSDDATGWARVEAALAVLSVDPAGLGGLWIRARAGPVRDRVMEGLAGVALPMLRVPPGVSDEALFGGTDLTAALSGRQAVRTPGLLDRPAILVLPMAERTPPALAARLALALDRGGQALIALDEGATGEESLPPALADRLAFFVDLDGTGWGDTEPVRLPAAVDPTVPELPHAARTALATAAVRLGIASLRAPLLASRAARAAAALRGAGTVGESDLRLAAELVYAHRATILPSPDERPDEAPPDDSGPEAPRPAPDNAPLPDEVLVSAARAALPHDVLERLARGRAQRGAAGSGAGAARKGNRRGRPLPSRPGRPGSGLCLDVVATLRVAAPWQAYRRIGQPDVAARLLLRPADLRVRRFQERSDRLLVFCVDASGSQAFARLSEAKGAVELLLAQAYARRDHVALVAFRGSGAELLLPPTRSLVQAKRRLAGLPGGGGTPLAAGLRTAMETALLGRARGMTPVLALLTDGRANVALDGTAGRAAAEADAARMALLLAERRLPGLVIDTAPRPQPALAELAARMGASCIALPRADAVRLSAALSGALAVT